MLSLSLPTPIMTIMTLVTPPLQQRESTTWRSQTRELLSSTFADVFTLQCKDSLPNKSPPSCPHVGRACTAVGFAAAPEAAVGVPDVVPRPRPRPAMRPAGSEKAIPTCTYCSLLGSSYRKWRKQLARIVNPVLGSVRMDSGWNCTAANGSSLCSIAIICHTKKATPKR